MAKQMNKPNTNGWRRRMLHDDEITLPAELVRRCTSWLDAYAGHEDEGYLRRLVEYVRAP